MYSKKNLIFFLIFFFLGNRPPCRYWAALKIFWNYILLTADGKCNSELLIYKNNNNTRRCGGWRSWFFRSSATNCVALPDFSILRKTLLSKIKKSIGNFFQHRTMISYKNNDGKNTFSIIDSPEKGFLYPKMFWLRSRYRNTLKWNFVFLE